MCKQEIKQGDLLLCLNSAGYYSLTAGKVYKASEDLIPGIFSDRPFVAVTGDNGKATSCHASRFVPVEGYSEGARVPAEVFEAAVNNRISSIVSEV